MSSFVQDHHPRIPRFLVAEDARALDLNGGELGRVAQVTNNGILVLCSSDKIADRLVQQGEVRMLLVEPRGQSSTYVDVVVRYREGRSLGFEYPAANASPDPLR